MIYEALDTALNEGPAAAFSFICIQFAFFLFLGLSATEDLLVSSSSIN
jgi:hypothetical protein